MQINKDTLAVLNNFKTIAKNIIIEPGNKLYIKRADNSVVARATIEQVFPSRMTIFDLESFLGSVSLFGEENNFEFHDDYCTIKSNDGKLKQTFVFTDETMLKCPTPAKADALFDVAPSVSFSIGKELLGTFMSGLAVNKANNITFENIDGEINITAVHCNDDGAVTTGSNLLKINTGVVSDKKFAVSVSDVSFKPPVDDYTIDIVEDKFVRLIGSTSSYIYVARGFSTFGE